MEEKKLEVNPEAEIVITGADVLFLFEALGALADDIGFSKMRTKQKKKTFIHLIAMIVGLIKIMPRENRKVAIETFSKALGIEESVVKDMLSVV